MVSEPYSWKQLKGPWMDEPDGDTFEFFADPFTEYRCAMRRNPMGAWCGYAAVPIGGFPYDPSAIEVHGGVTWTNDKLPDGSEELTGEQRWIGFDCAHGGDLIPGLKANEEFLARHIATLAEKVSTVRPYWETYRTYAWARAQTALMCLGAWELLESRKVTD